MHRRSYHRLTFLSLVAFALLFPGAALAQTQDYSVLIDSDNADATGCTVGSPPEAFLGADYRVVTTVDTTVDPPVVTNIALEVCSAPPSTWSPFAGPDPFTEFPTPFPAPTDGVYDAIESYVPLAFLASSPVVQLGFFSGPITAPLDVLFTTNGLPGGPAIQFGVPVVAIPTLAEWSMLLLALLLLATGIVALRHRASRAGLMLGLLLISGGLGVAIASSPHAADGNILDWTGHSAVANDASDDGVPNSDLGRAFAHVEGGNLHFRMDSDNTPDAPFAVDDAFTVAEDSGANQLDVRANDTDPPPPGLSILAVTQPANGTVAITNGGADVSYTPNAGYCNDPPGTTLDTFTYSIGPNPPGTVAISHATVSVTVTCVDDPPVAVDDAATVAEDAAPTSIDVLANDTDTDGGPKTISSATDPANGTVVVAGDGLSLTYQPDPGYCNTPIPPGTADTFDYTLAPGGDTATVSVTVTCDDDDPTAVDDAATVAEDAGPTSIDVLANDTDPDGGPKTIASATDPANGTVVVAGDGLSLTYQPDPDYCNSPIPPGTADTFDYTLSPGGDTATVSVTVTCADDNPVAVDDSATVAEDDPATTIDVLANDTDNESDPFTIASASDPANGTVVIAGDNLSLTYQPDPDYCNAPVPPGTADTFTYTLNPGGDTATVSVTVTCVDDDPVAVDDGAEVDEDAAATSIDVLANDTDVDAGPKTIASATDPANGTVVVAGDGLSLTYQPDPGYCNSPPGTTLDTFTYTLTQGGDTATVSVTVTCFDDPPLAFDDAATVAEDSGATSIDVLANDTDSDGGPKTIASATDPANGTVVVAVDGLSLTYQPDADYCNTPIPPGTADTFTYTLAQGGADPTATVSVTVTCANDGPRIDLDADDDKGTGGADFAVTFTEGDSATLLEDPADATLLDVEGDTVDSLTVTLTNIVDPTFELLDADVSAFPGLTKAYDTTTTPGTGVLTISGTESAANYETVLRTVTYLNSDTAPDETARIVTFVANDGTDDGNTATSTVTVVAEDTDPTAVDDSATVNEDSGANTIDVLANDTDPDGGPIAIDSVSQPTNGSVAITNAGADLTYTPDANYCNSPIPPGTADTFTYTLTPGGDSATVSVTVTCIEDNPVAVDDSATVNEDSGANTIDVQANDTDEDGGTNTITSVTQPTNGTVVITNGGADLTYAPNANYCNTPIPPGAVDTFTYTLSPGSDTATVSVTVTCIEDNPVAVDDNATVNEDSGANTINVQANDTDVDGGTNTIVSVTQPLNGSVAITNSGADLTYTPNANYCNSPVPPGTADTFTYTLDPGSDVGTVSVTVTCVDDPPIAVDDSATVNEDSGANTINVQGNDTDPDGGTNTITVVTQPANGVVAITNGGADLTYTPNLNFCNNPPGTTLETFDYTLSPASATPTATVTVTVTCINDPPALTDTTPNYTAIGNTQLRAGATPPVIAAVAFSTDASGVLANGKAGPITDVDGPGPIEVVPASGTSASGGTFTVEADGDFTYHPPVGFTGTDTFVVQVTDNGSAPSTTAATVTVAVAEMVWYVKNDTATAGTAGTSVDPFDTLVEAETASGVNHFIYVFEGDGNATGQNAGITLKNGQKFLGQGVSLVVSSQTLVTGNLANRPLVTDTTDTVTVLANTANGDRTGVQIRGFELASTGGNAIDVTSANAADLGVEIASNLVSGASLEGIDVNAGSTNATQELSLHDNTVTSTGNGIDITRTAGTLTITAFDDNQVSGNTAGSGIVVTGPVIFDTTPGGALDSVAGGTTLVGSSGNPVTGAGVAMSQVTGALSFTDLDIFAGTSGLFFQGTGTFTGATGASLSVTPASPDGVGTSTIDADNGAAVDVASATIDLRLDDLDSTTAGGGVALSSVAGQLKTDGDASITKSSGGGTAFLVSGSSANVTYAGTLNVSSGTGVSLTTSTGTMAFSGGMTLSTGANAGFTASGGGTVTVVDPAGVANNTITTTSGTALTVSGTTIGASGLTFESISSGTSGSPANGIVLSGTGAGGLTVTGTGTAGSGGTIQNTTSDAVRLTNAQNVSLSFMNLTNTASATTNASCHFENVAGCEAAVDMSVVTNVTLDDVVIDHNDAGHIGVAGNNVNGFTFTDGSVFDVGNADAESAILLQQLTGTVLLEDLMIDDPVEYGIRVFQPAGTGTLNMTVRRVTVQNNINTFGEAGFSIRATAGTSRVLVDDCDFVNTDGPGVDGQAINAAILHLTVQSTTFNENRALPIAVNFTTDNTSQGFVKISNNTVDDCDTAADCSIAFDLDANRTSSLHAIVTNNTVNAGTGIGTGMEFVVGDGATGRAEVRDNNFVMNTGEIGMTFHARNEGFVVTQNGRLDVTFEGNTVGGIQEAGLFNPGVQFLAGSSTGTHDQDVCVNTATSAGAGGNTITGVNNPGFTPRFEVTQRTGTTFILQGFGGTGTNAANVGAHFDNNNNATTLDPTFVRSTGTAIVNYTSGTCNTPTTPTLP